MSLYHHLPGKEGLLDGLVESVIGEISAELALAGAGGQDSQDSPDDWRAAVRRRCLTARVVMLRHPWAPGLISSRPTIPPAAYLHYEGLIAELVGGGLSYHLSHRALHSLGSLALGFAQEVFSPATADDGGQDPQEAEAEFARFAEFVPHLAAMAASEIHANDENVLGWCDSQAEFEFTLELLLDGLARAAAREASDGAGEGA